MLGQHWDVVGTLAKRGQMQRDDVESIVQIRAEGAAANLFFQLAIRGGDQPHIDRLRLGPTYGNHFALLEDAQQLYLRGRSRLADFVEEECPLRRRREETALVLDRASERPLHVAEQLALQEALGQRATVDRREGTVGAPRELVDVPRDDLLAGSRFALNEDGRFRRRDRLGQPQHLKPAAAVADRAGSDRAFPTLDLLTERPVLDAQFAMLGRPLEDGQQFVVPERRLDVIESALVHRLHRRLQRGLRGHENHRRVRIL